MGRSPPNQQPYFSPFGFVGYIDRCCLSQGPRNTVSRCRMMKALRVQANCCHLPLVKTREMAASSGLPYPSKRRAALVQHHYCGESDTANTRIREFAAYK